MLAPVWLFVVLQLLGYLVATLAVRSKVILVSMDGFRHDYLTKARTPNFDRMTAEGVRVPYMNNTFITSTFACHYAMATGLYSESNGIIGNTMYDPDFDSVFVKSITEPRWWESGEPIWTTAVKAGLKAGTYFWPGSEVAIHGIRPSAWLPYNKSAPFLGRLDQVVKWMSEDGFDLGIVYFNEPDTTGHLYGPDDARTVSAIEMMDGILGALFEKLDKASMKDKVNVIVASDHGMTSIDLDNRLIDLTVYANSTYLLSLVDAGATAQIRPQPGMDRQLLDKLSGIKNMKVMLKEDIPDRFHLKNNRRVMPLFAIADEGWSITNNVTRARRKSEKGDHGYDNSLMSMKPIFLARGPAFKSGATVDPIESVDIYPLICYLLDISPAPNNGSLDRASRLLKNFGNNVPHLKVSALLVWWFLIKQFI